MSKGKQESIGPHRLHQKTVQTNKNIRLYHNIDKRKKKPIIFFLRIEWFFILTNLNPFTEVCFVPSLVEIRPVVLGEDF